MPERRHAPVTVQEPRWRADLALWQVLAEQELANPRRRPINADLRECLLAPEVFAAEHDVEDGLAHGMSPDPPWGHGPTYPAPPPPRGEDWHEAPALSPWLRRYPTLAQLLDARGGVDAVYRWAGVPATEADVYGLHSAGFTASAIADLMVPRRSPRTVEHLIESAEERIHHALHHLDVAARAEAM
jgi:hypothetical protein